MKGNNDQILQRALEIVRETSIFIKSQLTKVSSNDIEEKEMNSLVSYVDKEAENMLVAGLSKIVEGCGFVTEEETENDDSKEYTWIIDPLDGTTNFLHQVPHFSISVALQKDSKTIIGVVKEVNSGEEWTAIKNQGAKLDGEPIKVNTKPFHDILIATGFPYSNNHDYDAYFDIIKYWLTNSRGMRRMGSAALDLCYVACGRFGAYYEATLNPWDLAAGALIVQEAGGIVSDYNGGDDYLFGKEIIASTPLVYGDVLDNIKKHLKIS